MIVLDTAVVVYWTLDPRRLSNAAREAIERAERIVVSSISIWEVAVKVARGRLVLPLPAADFALRLRDIKGVEITAVDDQLWLAAVALDWDHRDPADRVIVALATRLAAPLVTSDRAIRARYANAVW